MKACARPGCTGTASVKYCSRLCGGMASRGVDRTGAAQKAGITRRKRTLQEAVRKSGVLLSSRHVDALSSRDRARLLALLARAYRKGYNTGYQAGWVSLHRKRTVKAEAA